MSSNSCPRIFATAPIVSALRGRDGESLAGTRLSVSLRVFVPSSAAAIAISALQVAEFVLADLDLVAVLEAVRLDSPPVDVGAVQGAKVVDVETVAPAHDQRVVAGDGDVVEEHGGIRSPTDAHAVAVDREALARSAATGADHERSTGLVVLALHAAEVGPALLAVVGPLRIDEPALRAMQSQPRPPPPVAAPPCRRGCP